MSQSSHSVGNVSAPAFRAAMNDSLQALASLNSGPSAPSTTYANMLWYDTGANTLYMRSEADDAWIALGTLNQSTNTFTPAGSLTLASQAEAETGTDNTKVMTPLRVKQSVVANVPEQVQRFIPTTTYNFTYNPQSGPTTRSSGNITLPAGFYLVTISIGMTFFGAGSDESYSTSYEMIHSKNGSDVVLQSETLNVGSNRVSRFFSVTEALFEFGGNDFLRTIEPEASDPDHDGTSVSISITAKGPYTNATFI